MEQQGAGPAEDRGARLVAGLGHRPERHAVGGERLDVAADGDMEQRAVARARRDDLARASVHHRDLRGDEHADRVEVLVEQAVEPVEKRRRILVTRREPAQEAAKIGGDQRGGHALAHHVGDHQQRGVLAERDRVVEIPADLARAFPAARQAEARYLRQRDREQGTLDDPRHVQLTGGGRRRIGQPLAHDEHVLLGAAQVADLVHQGADDEKPAPALRLHRRRRERLRQVEVRGVVAHAQLDAARAAHGVHQHGEIAVRGLPVFDRVVAGLGHAQLAGEKLVVGHALLREKAAHRRGGGAGGDQVRHHGEPQGG